MRGRDAIARRRSATPTARSSCATEPLNSGLHRSRFARAPFVRGLVVLYETLVVGTRWLIRSANVQAERGGRRAGPRRDRADARRHARAGDRRVLPAAAVRRARSRPRQHRRTALVQHLVEGLIRVAIFLGYLLLVSRDRRHPARLPVPRRRAHDDPRPGARRPADRRRRPQVPDRPPALRHRVPGRLHPRCPSSCSAWSGARRLLVMHRRPDPAHPGHRRGRLRAAPLGRPASRQPGRHGCSCPGIWLQGITTKQPDDDMIEVAIASMERGARRRRRGGPGGLG